MSEFQRILSPAQLTKHYEVIQFLTQHPNQEYSLAQLDTLLPHGVAVQRFPEEWFDLVEGGACWHRSIELRRPHVTTTPLPEEESGGQGTSKERGLTSVLAPAAASAQSRATQRTQYFLSCVKAEIRTLEELRCRLESPSTLLDVDGCVALHTDQIIISPELLLRAQRTGLAYYFSDVYDKNEFRRFGMKDISAASLSTAEASTGAAGTRANAGQATAAMLDSFVNQDESSREKLTSSLGGGSRSRTYVALPPGVRVQHQLLTRRGVPEQEDYCLPTKMYVGERLRLLFDNAVAVTKLSQRNELNVQLSMTGVKASKGEKGISSAGAAATVRHDALSSEPPPPLRIRKEMQAVRHTAAVVSSTSVAPVISSGSLVVAPKDADNTNNSVAPSAPMGPPAPVLVSTTAKVEVEALYASTFTLLLTVNGVENVLSMEVAEETTQMPGVLILRDRQLDSFALPRSAMLADPLVNPPLESHYPFEVLVPPSPPASHHTGGASGMSLSAEQREALQCGPWSELVPLPWTQNPSPVVLRLREATYPTQHTTVQAATRAVFSAQSLADEARLRQTREHLRREADQREGVGAGGKRRRMRYRGNMFLSNRHLLHFGLDFSIPFTRQPT